MNDHLRTLQRLIDEGMYVIDAGMVADAIIARGKVNAAVANVGFRPAAAPPPVRSFRRDPHARSFRLERGGRARH
jgi:hypothetical protein